MILPLLLCITAFSSAIEHPDEEFLGMTCPGRDRCKDMSPNATQDFTLRNCECDSECAVYGDCCLDAKHATSRRKSNPGLKCVGFGHEPYIGAYMVVDCPAGADPDIKQKCETVFDTDDPFLSVLVTAPNGSTYPNAYCAACNGAALDRLIRWDELANRNAGSAYIWRHLKKHAREWGVESESDAYADVRFGFDRPADAIGRVRLCRRGLTKDSGLKPVGDCPGGYVLGTVREACAAYTAVVYENSRAFRNPHCAFCNGVDMEDLACEGLRRKEFSFATSSLVRVRRDNGCPGDQKFDPFRKACRDLACSIPEFVKRNNTCVRLKP